MPGSVNQNQGRKCGVAKYQKVLIGILLSLSCWVGLEAQQIPDTSTKPTEQQQSMGEPAPEQDDTLVTMFHHAEWDRFWLSGQANFISQYHPKFTSPYQGKNSLTPEAQDATSRRFDALHGLASDFDHGISM